jgi:hypothetical protein
MRKSPIFDNNTQLSLLLTCDHEQKILSTDFYFFLVDPYDPGPREKKKGVWIYGDYPRPHPPRPQTIRVCLIMVIPTLLEI